MDRPDVLLLTSDPRLRDDVLRLVAVAGRDAALGADPRSARAAWADAATVLLDADLLALAGESVLPRRAGVVVVSAAEPDPATWAAALAVGADSVLVLPRDEAELVSALASPVPGSVRATTVGVVGGSGGAGASVLASALALAWARRGADVLLLDADPVSGGLDLLLAAEDEPGARWPELAGISGTLAPGSLARALPQVQGVHVLSAGRDGGASGSLVPVVDAARAGDVVVLDLPRARTEVLDALLPRCDHVLVVVTADVRGAAAARATVRELAPRCRPQLVVRRRARGGCDIDEVADWVGAPVLAELDDDRGLTASVDAGGVPGSAGRSRLARTCAGIVERLEERR